jgi:HEAT repeat protein
VRSLGEIGDSRAVEPLLAVIDRTNFSGVVAEALARIGDRRAVGPLIAFLEKAARQDQLRTRKWFVESLEKLSGQKFGNDVARWRRWYETEGKR